MKGQRETTGATPGPWRVGHSQNFPEHYVVEVREGHYKALICYGVYGDEKHIGGERYQGNKAANAHLIAAAPAMRDALVYLDEYLAAMDADVERGVLPCSRLALGAAREKARAALRAANGETGGANGELRERTP